MYIFKLLKFMLKVGIEITCMLNTMIYATVNDPKKLTTVQHKKI